MKATKEAARKAYRALSSIQFPESEAERQEALRFIQDFLVAAERDLPREPKAKPQMDDFERKV